MEQKTNGIPEQKAAAAGGMDAKKIETAPQGAPAQVLDAPQTQRLRSFLSSRF